MRTLRLALFPLLAMLLTAGCGALNPTPGATVTASSATIERVADEIGAAQLMGQISVEREAALLDRLQAANDALRAAYAVRDAGGDHTSLLEAISAELTRIRIELAQEQQP